MPKFGSGHGGRGTGKPGPVDAHIGARVRLRRRQLGMRQASLGEAIAVSFQMVQRYEQGLDRISAAGLYHIAKALEVPIGFFFEDMPVALAARTTVQGSGKAKEAPYYELDPVVKRETLQLLRAYYDISDPRVREQLFAMVKVLGAAASGDD